MKTIIQPPGETVREGLHVRIIGTPEARQHQAFHIRRTIAIIIAKIEKIGCSQDENPAGITRDS